MQPSPIKTQLARQFQQVSDTGEGMCRPQGSCDAVCSSVNVAVLDDACSAHSEIMISGAMNALEEDFNSCFGSSENERGKCIITSSGKEDDTGSRNLEFKDGSDQYISESCCSIDIDIQYLLGAIDEEQQQGFLLPSWQPELGNESFLNSGYTVDEFFWSETEATQLLELCTSDFWFGTEEAGGVGPFTDEDWLAESLNGDFLTDSCDEMEFHS